MIPDIFCVFCGLKIGRAAECPACRAPNLYAGKDPPLTVAVVPPVFDDTATTPRPPPLEEQPPLPPPPPAPAEAPRAPGPPAEEGRQTILLPKDGDRHTIAWPPPPIGKLVRVAPPGDDIVLRDGACTVGGDRRRCDVLVDGEAVSGCHARLECSRTTAGSRVVVRDEHSRNGTFVNEKQIQECELKPDDEIRFANIRFRFKAGV